MTKQPQESEAPLILGVSGLRGIVGESLTPEVAMRYAAAFADWLHDQVEDRCPLILVARDGREGGDMVYFAAISGLLASQCRVRLLDVAMTPSVGVMVDLVRADAAVIVTASHNPQEWNGLKVLVNRSMWTDSEGSDCRGQIETAVVSSCAPDADMAGEIVQAFKTNRYEWGDQQDLFSTVNEDDAENSHCYRVCMSCERLFGVGYFWDLFEEHPVIVVLDSLNASGGFTTKLFLEGTPVRPIQLHGESSGIFPHTPEPTKENLSGEGGLCDAVPGLKGDVGFAQDPDADRLAIVDERGAYIGEEYTLVLCAMSLLDAMGDDAKDTVLVTNLSTSRMVEDVAAKYGARVERTPVGEANVVQRMKRLMADAHLVALGGEGNGGVIWPEVTFVRDSLSGMALVLALMARTGKTISELVTEVNKLSPGGAGYAIIKRKVDIASKADADPAVKAVAKWAKQTAGARTDTQDGVRVDFDGGERAGSWVHIRASNTEPIMRLICEAPTTKIAESILAETETAIG